ncbi:MAG: hypothetical protein QW156_03735 [Candidatus Aenigmatarchaeota archaeon]
MSKENKLPGNNTSDNNMRICAIVTGRETDIEKERVVKGEVTNNNNSSSTETGSLDNSTHMCISANKLNDISTNSGRINIWLSKELKKAVKMSGMDVSAFVREKLIEELSKRNIPVEESDPELIIRIRCPSCGFEQNTSTIKLVRCINCDYHFRVFTRRGSRIRKIVKGNEFLLQKLYYRIYGRKRYY